MIFSKSFGYALRGVLYVSAMSENGKRIRIEEIAKKLGVPKHFLGKVMNKVVKENILYSAKGFYGGFFVNESTLSTPLIKLFEIAGDGQTFTTCALSLKKCNRQNPCPLHDTIVKTRDSFYEILKTTTIKDLLIKKNPDLVRSLAIMPD